MGLRSKQPQRKKNRGFLDQLLQMSRTHISFKVTGGLSPLNVSNLRHGTRGALNSHKMQGWPTTAIGDSSRLCKTHHLNSSNCIHESLKLWYVVGSIQKETGGKCCHYMINRPWGKAKVGNSGIRGSPISESVITWQSCYPLVTQFVRHRRLLERAQYAERNPKEHPSNTVKNKLLNWNHITPGNFCDATERKRAGKRDAEDAFSMTLLIWVWWAILTSSWYDTVT